ncbi:hypothetical protein TNCV_4354381 [Trichonephila clavipes]|nr:hypothetical protein TNCV_4354381 [Trichonephila clavipes]
MGRLFSERPGGRVTGVGLLQGRVILTYIERSSLIFPKAFFCSRFEFASKKLPFESYSRPVVQRGPMLATFVEALYPPVGAWCFDPGFNATEEKAYACLICGGSMSLPWPGVEVRRGVLHCRLIRVQNDEVRFQ